MKSKKETIKKENPKSKFNLWFRSLFPELKIEIVKDNKPEPKTPNNTPDIKK